MVSLLPPAFVLGVYLLMIPGRGPSSAENHPGGFAATLEIKEPGFDASLRISLFHDSEFFSIPDSTGYLFLVSADQAAGEDAFFIPTDLAFEFGDSLVYRVEFEQASDFFGQALGGKLRSGETQIGFILLPHAIGLDRILEGGPQNVVVRYANHRSSLRPAVMDEANRWRELVDQRLLAAGLNLWWEWIRTINRAPSMNEGERRFFAERVLPGQGHILAEEDMSHEALRNALLRVGERKLLESRSIQRVAPRYPAAARQVGARGLVVTLCYINPGGEVADALILASNTAHMLNLSALSAVQEWKFSRATGLDGKSGDGWKLIPMQFLLEPSAAVAQGSADGYELPRVVKRVDPEYSFEAKRLKLSGTVVYRVVVDAKGKLKRAVLEEGVHPILNQASLVAIEKSLFLPATRDGKPVEGELVMPFRFVHKP